MICEGCLVLSTCYPIGYRVAGEYCSDGEFIDQFEEGSVCENDFECDSNFCVSGECISGSLLRKLIAWFKGLFN